ncbi:hypothetical protein, partial [Agrobacterium vitis]|uniref:hypothetical protein n=1 Tax=Agrobacterium vitis TaxID=373 RepID=UPI001AEE3BC5
MRRALGLDFRADISVYFQQFTRNVIKVIKTGLTYCLCGLRTRLQKTRAAALLATVYFASEYHDRLGLEPGFAGTFGFRVVEVLTVFAVCYLTIEDRRKRNVDG